MTHTPADAIDNADSARLHACLAACAGIPTEKLRPGIVRELHKALDGLMNDGGGQYVDQCAALLRELGEP